MATPWLLRMRRLDMLFAHWPLDPDASRAVIPPALELEAFEGRAWIGVVPFTMTNVDPPRRPATRRPRLGASPRLRPRRPISRGADGSGAEGGGS
jgi:uncharacterized protein